MKRSIHLFGWLLVVFLLSFPSNSFGLSAEEVIRLAQRQLEMPEELVKGEMLVYRGEKGKERLARSYSFTMGRLWNEGEKAEYVRIDFESAIEGDPNIDTRYLLKRRDGSTNQYLYLKALRRVRQTPFEKADPLLQGDYWFYDLTHLSNFNDYQYQFLEVSEEKPVIKGIVSSLDSPSPYKEVIFYLEKREGKYLPTKMIYTPLSRDEKREAQLDFIEVAPGCFRAEKIRVVGKWGFTELILRGWTLEKNPNPRLFTSVDLETRKLNHPLHKGGTER